MGERGKFRPTRMDLWSHGSAKGQLITVVSAQLFLGG